MKTPLLSYLLISFVTLLLLTQCQKVAPQPPKAEGFDPPLKPTPSYLSGSIKLPVRALEAKINKELDPVLVGKGSKEGGTKSLIPFSVIRSGSVRIYYNNQQVRFSTPLQVQLAKPFSKNPDTPSDKPFCAIQVDFMSPLTLTPAWRLASHVKFVDYKWQVEPKIKLLGKTISLTDFAQNIIDKYRSSIEAAIDSAVYKDLRLDKMVAPIWRDIQNPLVLNKQYGLWLLPQPSSITASPITGNGQQITAPLLITLNPKTEVQPHKPDYKPIALPTLKKQDHLQEISDLNVISFIPFADINRIAEQTLQKKNFKLALGTLTVKKVSVYGGQRSVVVRTEVSGLLNGTLFLRGRPGFDTTTNTLRVNNLEFDSQTENSLSGLAVRTFKDGLSSLLEELLSVSLGEEINQLPQKIDAAFEKSKAGQKINLNIQSFKFAPQKIAIQPTGIQALIKVRSKVAMEVQHL